MVRGKDWFQKEQAADEANKFVCVIKRVSIFGDFSLLNHPPGRIIPNHSHFLRLDTNVSRITHPSVHLFNILMYFRVKHARPHFTVYILQPFRSHVICVLLGVTSCCVVWFILV